jgi:ApbE superfamily uncharacterized protein (UPF0280 family)
MWAFWVACSPTAIRTEINSNGGKVGSHAGKQIAVGLYIIV